MTKKSNIIPFPKTNIREVKIKDIAEELETQMIKIKEQRELIEGQREEIMKSILDYQCMILKNLNKKLKVKLQL